MIEDIAFFHNSKYMFVAGDNTILVIDIEN
jgi:hypothetical protein